MWPPTASVPSASLPSWCPPTWPTWGPVVWWRAPPSLPAKPWTRWATPATPAAACPTRCRSEAGDPLHFHGAAPGLTSPLPPSRRTQWWRCCCQTGSGCPPSSSGACPNSHRLDAEWTARRDSSWRTLLSHFSRCAMIHMLKRWYLTGA